MHILMLQVYEIWLKDWVNPVLLTNHFEGCAFVLLLTGLSVFGKQIENNAITKILTKVVVYIITILVPKLTYSKIFKSH